MLTSQGLRTSLIRIAMLLLLVFLVREAAASETVPAAAGHGVYHQLSTK